MKNEYGFVLLSKFQLPEITPKILYRGRLINLLVQNMHKKLIFLKAGAGYGKTTLISQFINEAKLFYLYYQLKRDDSDPSTFLFHLIAGIKSIYPEFGEKIYKLSNFFNLPQGMSGVVLGTLVNEMFNTFKYDTYLILDDYHNLEDSTTIDSIIYYLLENMPKKLHLIICSRSELSVPLAKLKANDEILEITTDDLCFTKDEIFALFTTIYNLKLSEDEIEWLIKYSEGWPACLSLILQTYGIKQDEKNELFKRIQVEYKKFSENIFDYFAQEVFKREPPEYQKFLIDCSLLDYLNPDICKAATGLDNCQKIIEEIFRRNAFIFALPDGNYRFHSLFQDFLRSKFQNGNRKREIYHRLADYYTNVNQEEALKYYLLAEDHPRVIQMVELIGQKMLEQGRYRIIISAIEKLPKELLNRNFKILKYYGEALSYIGDLAKAKDVLMIALRMVRKDKELKTEIMYALGGVLINQGNLKEAIKLLKKLLRICPDKLYLLKASAMNSLGAIDNSLGGKGLIEARRLFRQAFRIAERHKLDELKTSILNNWAMNEFKMGNLKGAYSKILPAIELLKEHFSLGCGAGFYNGARISLLLGDINGANRILKTGMEVCKAYNDPWSMAGLWRGFGLLTIEVDDLKTAREYINKALGVYEQLKVPWLIITALNELCRIEIMDNDIVEAERIINKINEIKKTKDDADSISIHLTKAQIKIARDEYDKALELLNKARELSQRYKLGFDLFLTDLKLCTVLNKKNRTNELKRLLFRLMDKAEKNGFDFILLKELKRDKNLLNFILNNRIRLNYLFSILKKFKPFHIIQVSFFGNPSLKINGTLVNEDKWQTTKAKKLFFYLLFNKTRSFTQDELIEIFWPKSGLKQGYTSLRKAIHHIRKALYDYGIDEPILVQSGSYQISPDLYIISDVDEFESLLTEYKKRGIDKLKYKRIFEIYKNGFARNWFDNWAIEQFDKYEQMMERIKCNCQ
uniref:Tetratricopeptide repeat protein n=1 Tax=candidate division WOR-3 bacterium TaxID=2052148 RepID=A0A7V3RIN7_UNCW3